MTRIYDKWLELGPGLAGAAEKAYSSGGIVLPKRDNVFRAFSYFPPEDTKVVILGQDPYHSVLEKPSVPGGIVKASGLSFGFSRKYIEHFGKLHSSLLNIRDEVRSSGFEVPEYPDPWYALEHWARQGVLLLNTRLTVLEGEPMSHGQIWRDSVAELLRNLDELNTDIIYLGWGAEARTMLEGRAKANLITTSHPCMYSNSRATANTPAFTGSKCFSEVNSRLISQRREPVKWGGI